MSVDLTISQFRSDTQGAKFEDVINDNRINFQAWIDFFNDPARQQRLLDSEKHHLRPALAGVIIELEQSSDFEPFLAGYDAHTTRRGRQAIGVIVRIIMEHSGWHKIPGMKSSLGQRARTAPRTTTPGAYQNTSGLSKWFSRAQRYEEIR